MIPSGKPTYAEGLISTGLAPTETLVTQGTCPWSSLTSSLAGTGDTDPSSLDSEGELETLWPLRSWEDG